MPRKISRALGHGGAASLCLVCVSCLGLLGAASGRAEWKADWNARVDAAESRKDHPCGDFVFDAWADDFLVQCKYPSQEMEAECRERTEWVWARSNQCSKWQDWLLRNHTKQQRRDHLKEPETRVR